MKGLIYILTDPRDGRVRYCGKTVKTPQERLKAHLWARPRLAHRPLYQWIDELLRLSLCPQISVVEEVDFDGLVRNEQINLHNEAEIRWIANLRLSHADLLNGTSGGNGAHGVKLSPERIEKLRQANRDRIVTPESRERRSAAAKARGEAHFRRGMESEGWGDQSRIDAKARAEKNRQIWAAKSEAELKAHGQHSRTVWTSAMLRQQQSERHRGERNYRASITADIAKAIYAAPEGAAALSKKFGVSRKIVGDIKHLRSWRHATIGTGE